MDNYCSQMMLRRHRGPRFEMHKEHKHFDDVNDDHRGNFMSGLISKYVNPPTFM